MCSWKMKKMGSCYCERVFTVAKKKYQREIDERGEREPERENR